MGEKSGVYMVLVGKPDRKKPLEKPRRRWEDIIKMDLQEVGWFYGRD
jgi:S-ribosylhomocysteine lyase LuxS involved in autoinducer biosynthesis